MSEPEWPGIVLPGGDSPLPRLYAAALRNLLETNTVPGRGGGEPPLFIRAGGGYPEPWTRDAAINAWGGASMLAPEAARDTLLMVCDTLPDGRRVVAQDNQWWDQIIWVIAAWNHFLVTGDEEFADLAFAISRDSLAILHRDRFRPRYGLYAGGSVMQDGISGYPQPPSEQGNPSTFVLDYPLAHEIMCLSTNAIYVAALRCLAAMAERAETSERSKESGKADGLERTVASPTGYAERATRLASAINDRLWIERSGSYGYFVHGDGPLAGAVDRHQEAAGLGFALMFGIATERQRDLLLAGVHREPCGVVNVWPHFPERFSDEYPGRHNVICWPMVMGMFGDGAARAGSTAVLDQTLRDLEALFVGSGDGLFELYNARTGVPDGGWQHGVHWRSEPDQTWSATALLRLVHLGLFGIRHAPEGIRFEPAVPPRFDRARLAGLPYRHATLDVVLAGHGSALKAVRLDGRAVPGPVHVPAGLTGRHQIELEVG
jgi:glycogen debranching enzyme